MVVGTAVDTVVSPKTCTSGYFRTYRFTDDGAGLEFLHKVHTLTFHTRLDAKFVTRLKLMMFPSSLWHSKAEWLLVLGKP